MYWKDPRQADYPLNKIRNTGLNTDYFNKAKPNQNPYKPEELTIEYKGQWFRSKNELSAAQAVEAMGYRFKSEIHVVGSKKNFDHFKVEDASHVSITLPHSSVVHLTVEI